MSFIQKYQQRAHETQRSGPQPDTLPSVRELDDFMRKSTGIHSSLSRMREVVIEHEQAQVARAQEQPRKMLEHFEQCDRDRDLMPPPEENPELVALQALMRRREEA